MRCHFKIGNFVFRAPEDIITHSNEATLVFVLNKRNSRR